MNPTMYYKHPGPYALEDGSYDYKAIDADDPDAVKAAEADGWHKTMLAAKAAGEAAAKAPKK